MRRIPIPLLLALYLTACTDSGGTADSSTSAPGPAGTSAPEAPPGGDDPVATSVADASGSTTTLDDESATAGAVSPPNSGESTASGQVQDVGGESLGPLGETELDIETDDGRVQIGTAELPALASAVPLPDGLELLLASETEADATYSGESSATSAELLGFYETALPDAGFDVTDVERASDSVAVLRFSGDGLDGEVVLSDAPSGGTTVIVAVTRR